MAAGPKLVADCTEYGTEARRVPEAFEPLETALTPADRLVRILDPIVLAPAAKMGDARQYGGFRGRIARQPVGHDRARYHSKASQEFAKAALRGPRAPTALDQDVEHLARVIDSPPQPTALPIDHQTQFIEMPDVRARTSRPSQSSCILQAEPQRPEADGFVRDLNATDKEQFGDVAQAHREAIVQPHTMADDLGRVPIAFVERGAGEQLRHGRHQSRPPNVLTMPRRGLLFILFSRLSQKAF